MEEDTNGNRIAALEAKVDQLIRLGGLSSKLGESLAEKAVRTDARLEALEKSVYAR